MLRRILTYLIPCRLLTTHTLPSAQLLAPYPRLQSHFGPLAKAIKKGDLLAFDLALQEGEDDFVRKKIYLTLERSRDIALRNLLRKVFLTKGFVEPKNPDDAPVRQTRVRIAEFAAAISLGSRENIDSDEVECLLANMIYKVRAVQCAVSAALRCLRARCRVRVAWPVPVLIHSVPCFRGRLQVQILRARNASVPSFYPRQRPAASQAARARVARHQRP